MDKQSILDQIVKFLVGWFGKDESLNITVDAPAPAPAPVQAAAPASMFTLIRKEFRPDGIFSELHDKSGSVVSHTLEHSYNNLPKIPNGTFKCVRGPHRLHNMTEDFITFEITGVAGHSDLLFHWGNYNKDSDGCVLMGEAVAEAGSAEMVTSSRANWAKFMASLEGVNEFYLTVQ